MREREKERERERRGGWGRERRKMKKNLTENTIAITESKLFIII